MLREKWIVLNTYIRRKEDSQVNNRSSHLENLENESKINPKQGKRKKKINTRAEVNKTENSKSNKNL